jgi:H2-forming N5,N10-methylenetetrahydromethanopterin dehydrogenase-like enzyme
MSVATVATVATVDEEVTAAVACKIVVTTAQMVAQVEILVLVEMQEMAAPEEMLEHSI